MLVYGGTAPKGLDEGNRQYEDAVELEPCLNIELYAIFKNVVASKNIDELIRGFELFNKCDVHLVGSRGYVYNSGKITGILKATKSLPTLSIEFRQFPRTGGFRQAVYEACEANQSLSKRD